MSVVTEAEVIARLPSLLEEAKRRAVIISDGNDNDLGAIVSMEDLAIVRRDKAEKFLCAMKEFGDDIRARAAEDGLSADDLIKILDRKAS